MIRNKDIAREINLLMLKIGADIDKSIAMVKDNCTQEEFEAYRKAAGKIMGDMLLEVMNPIYKTHPDLKPTEMK